MARHQKDVVNYFPHDTDACAGDTLTVLQSRFGNDGYAFWFKLLEKLSSTEGHYIDCRNKTKWQLLLAKTGVNEITGVEIMNLLVEMQTIDKELWESRLIWCQKLVDNVSDVYKNRRREIPKRPVFDKTTGSYLITTSKNVLEGEKTPEKGAEKFKKTSFEKPLYCKPSCSNPITTDDNDITTGGDSPLPPPYPPPTPKSKVKESKVKNIYSNKFPNVTFTPDENSKLVEEFGENGLRQRVERLSLYKQSTGKRYASDYATILTWERRNPQNPGKKYEVVN